MADESVEELAWSAPFVLWVSVSPIEGVEVARDDTERD
jgi:hypothetical protein